MKVIREKISYFRVVTIFILLSFCYLTGIAFAQTESQIIIDENLKPGMTLKDAIELLGPPEKLKISDIGTVIISYGNIGLSLEVLSDGTVIEAIHIQSGFKGRFASGIAMGDDTRKIIACCKQPDTQTDEVMEYPLSSRRFHISKDKLTGADLYRENSALYHLIPVKRVKNLEEKAPEKNEKKVSESIAEKVAPQPGGKEEEDYYNEEEEDQKAPEIDVFALYGFKVKQEYSRVVVTEVTPGSFADECGLRPGEPIRKVFYEKSSERNIYAISGLKSILKRAIEKRKKFVNILQSNNTYIKMKVPRIYTTR
jgi:hypothetical protein